MIRPYKCVVVANGRFPATARPLERLREASVRIACDGAVEALQAAGFPPDAVVGDLDSMPLQLQSSYAGRIHRVIDQEINDLTKAMQFARDQGHREVLILGATGLREDHTLGNISLLAEYARWFDRVEMLSDYGLFTPLLQSAVLESFPGQQVSLFSLNPMAPVGTEGLRWPLHDRCLTAWWQGTLNEATGDRFSVLLPPGSCVIVYRLIGEKRN